MPRSDGRCSFAMLAVLLGIADAQQQRLVASNRSLYLDGSGPVLLRAVWYSPLPWGNDDDLFFRTAVYTSEYSQMFERDLRLMSAMGANAVRLHGFMGVTDRGGRHEAYVPIGVYDADLGLLHGRAGAFFIW